MNVLSALLLAVVFGGVIARQLTGRGPVVWIWFAVGAVATVALGIVPVVGTGTILLDAGPVVLFLLALFLFAGALEGAGALDHAARWLVQRARRPEDLPAILFLGFGIASAFLLNDALVLIGVPLLVVVARSIRVAPAPLLLVLAFSVSVGSVLTPFGNPQNLLVALASGLADPVATFLRYLLVPTVISLAIGAAYLRWLFASRMRSATGAISPPSHDPMPLLPRGGWASRLVRHPVLWIFPGTMILIITLSVTATLTRGAVVPAWGVALGGAAILLIASPGRARLVRHVNWSILVLFAGLFLVVGGAEQSGVIAALEGFLPIAAPSHPFWGLVGIVSTSAAGPQLVSNVPWVALQIPLLGALGYGASTPVAWVGLAAASTLAGNVTLLGAASNLIVVELADKEGIPIRLGEFVRYGLPLAAMTLAVLFTSLFLGL